VRLETKEAQDVEGDTAFLNCYKMTDWNVKAKEILAKIKSYRDEKDDWKIVKSSVSF